MTSTARLPGHALRVGPFSTVVRVRPVLICAVLAALIFVLACISVAIGDVQRSPVRVAQVLLGGGSRVEQLVIVQLRLPRTLVAVSVGAALGLAGALVQSIARNPLASPDILGVSAGASAGAVLVIVVGGASGWLSTVGAPVAAVVGGLGTGLLIGAAAWHRGLDTYRIVLVGIGVNAVMSAVVALLLTRAQIDSAARANLWLTGSVEGRTWDQVWPVLGTFGVIGAGLIVSGHQLRSLRLGDDHARGLGLHTTRSRTLLLLAAVVLTSVAASAAGPVAFIAFVAPQVMRRVMRSAGEPLVGSAIGGAVLLLGADVLIRALPVTELPVGLVTTMAGAPYLLYLLLQRRRVRG